MTIRQSIKTALLSFLFLSMPALAKDAADEKLHNGKTAGGSALHDYSSRRLSLAPGRLPEPPLQDKPNLSLLAQSLASKRKALPLHSSDRPGNHLLCEKARVANRILPRSSTCQEEVEKAESSKLPQLQLAPKLIDLGDAYRREGATMEAIPVYERALEIYKKAGQIGGARSMECQLALGDLYEDSGRFDKSAKVYGDAAGLKETTDAYRVQLLHKLAAVLVKGGQQLQAIAVYKKALTACEKYYGSNHPAVADLLLEYSAVLQKENQPAEAKKLSDRAKAILSKKSKNPIKG